MENLNSFLRLSRARVLLAHGCVPKKPHFNASRLGSGWKGYRFNGDWKIQCLEIFDQLAPPQDISLLDPIFMARCGPEKTVAYS
jgi:hypothetical protein